MELSSAMQSVTEVPVIVLSNSIHSAEKTSDSTIQTVIVMELSSAMQSVTEVPGSIQTVTVLSNSIHSAEKTSDSTIQKVMELSSAMQSVTELPDSIRSVTVLSNSIPSAEKTSDSTIQKVMELSSAMQSVTEVADSIQSVTILSNSMHTRAGETLDSTIQKVMELSSAMQSVTEVPGSMQSATLLSNAIHSDEKTSDSTIQKVMELSSAMQSVTEVPDSIQSVTELSNSIHSVEKTSDSTIQKVMELSSALQCQVPDSMHTVTELSYSIHCAEETSGSTQKVVVESDLLDVLTEVSDPVVPGVARLSDSIQSLSEVLDLTVHKDINVIDSEFSNIAAIHSDADSIIPPTPPELVRADRKCLFKCRRNLWSKESCRDSVIHDVTFYRKKDLSKSADKSDFFEIGCEPSAKNQFDSDDESAKVSSEEYDSSEDEVFKSYASDPSDEILTDATEEYLIENIPAPASNVDETSSSSGTVDKPSCSEVKCEFCFVLV